MRTFWNFNGGIKHIDAWEPNCWVQVTCPVDDDREFLEQELGMPDYFMEDVSDADERARYDMDEGWLMIILAHSTPEKRDLAQPLHHHPFGNCAER